MSEETVDVVIYSSDSEKRKRVMEGTGRRPGRDSRTINWIETATSDGVVTAVKEKQPAIMVLDAETPKNGGMSVAKRVENELDFQPLLVLLTARPQDDWLAKWAGAAYTVLAPYDPLELQTVMTDALKWAE